MGCPDYLVIPDVLDLKANLANAVCLGLQVLLVFHWTISTAAREAASCPALDGRKESKEIPAPKVIEVPMVNLAHLVLEAKRVIQDFLVSKAISGQPVQLARQVLQVHQDRRLSYPVLEDSKVTRAIKETEVNEANLARLVRLAHPVQLVKSAFQAIK